MSADEGEDQEGGGGSEPELSGASDGSGGGGGSPGTMELLASDTQRILRGALLADKLADLGALDPAGRLHRLHHRTPSLPHTCLGLHPPACPMTVPAETAARDRLGKGHKIEIQPLSSILGMIKQRQALAIARWGDGVVCWLAGSAGSSMDMAGSAAGASSTGSHGHHAAGKGPNKPTQLSCHCCPIRLRCLQGPQGCCA